MATLSMSSSDAAEALLSRARRLSSNAYARTRTPTALTSFAEGEDSSLSSSPSSPSSLRLNHHRDSYKDRLRDNSRRRSSLMAASPTSPTTSVSSVKEEQDHDIHPITTTDNKTSIRISTASSIDPDSVEQVLVQSPLAFAPGESLESFESLDKTPAEPRRSRPIMNRPRALTLEAIRESTAAQSLALQPHSAHPSSSGHAPMDLHRKHRSENSSSSGLVHGVLHALRNGDPDTLTSWTTNTATTTALVSSPISTDLISSSSAPVPSSEQPSPAHSQKAKEEDKPSQLSDSLPATSSAISPTSPATATATTITTTATSVPSSPSTPSTLVAPVVVECAPTAKEEFVPEERPLPPSKSTEEGESPVRVLAQHNRHESILAEEGTDDDHCRMTSAPAQLPAMTNSSSKLSKRSSKLFGKLVPKFLQTSFGPSSSSSGSSPRSAPPASPSPLSSRPGKSNSPPARTLVSSSSTASTTSFALEASRKTTLPALPSSTLSESPKEWLSFQASNSPLMEKDLLSVMGHSHDDHCSTDAHSTTPEIMQTNTLINNSEPLATPPLLSARHSSISSLTSRRSLWTNADPNASRESMSSLAGSEGKPAAGGSAYSPIQGHQSVTGSGQSKVLVVEEVVMVENEDIDNEMQHNDFEQDQEPMMSPYIIDESCDDDFFLNSVLRKSRPSSQLPAARPSAFATGWNQSSFGSTSTCSARASSPGPNTPAWSSSSSTLPMSMSTSPLLSSDSTVSGLTPSPPPGQDEKRSRLRDAVGEWRRSTLPPAHPSSGYAS